MAFFGKIVAPRDEKKRLSPIQMHDFDDSEIIKQFEKTLVGRVLNPKQTHWVKALIAFLPEVWKCQDRVKGINMETGKFQFRFDQESDITQVLARRPYHFDGWFFALERWIPTSRIDFPSSIPMWIQIHNLPDCRCYEKGVVEIKEKLGDLMA
ncbi:unnamed protein product [Arabis nemorensis]|uniref:DUF4283 domain-containing protein n=1 Tax=Arabis nemorensis TaxID=586526 RepID=A0A565CCW7_9BRAS|nr:unnamed protein product [Arabis nemorensis]